MIRVGSAQALSSAARGNALAEGLHTTKSGVTA